MTAAASAVAAAAGVERYEFVAGDNPRPARLDAWLAGQSRLAAAGLSRSRLQALAAGGLISVNGAAARPAQRVRNGDVVIVRAPPPVPPADLRPQNLPLSIVYEDSDVAVVDKPAGLPAHPGPGHPDGTLVNALLARCPDIKGVGGELRPGIVHRLDRDTSGLLVVAKNQKAHQHLAEQLKNRTMLKEYLTVAVGRVDPASGIIDAPIARDPRRRQRMAVAAGGRPARTHYDTLERRANHTLLQARLETGRTHQIRTHLAYLGHPIWGDAVYGRAGGGEGPERQFLHAARLGFYHPATGEWSEHRAPLPAELAAAWAALGP